MALLPTAIHDHPSADAAAFDVACMAAAAGAPLTPSGIQSAAQALARERDDGTTADDVLAHLAIAAVALYPPAAPVTPRRAIFALLNEHLPRELGDMPARLDGANRAQLGDVLALLEQSFGGRADSVAGPDVVADLLRRCDALERENAELRAQADDAVARLGVADALRSNAELVAALYQAVAVADAAKIATAVGSSGGGTLGGRGRIVATRDAASTCDLSTSASGASSPSSAAADGGNDDPRHQKLVARLAEVERRLTSSAAAAEERALDAERKVVVLQQQLLDARRAASLGLPLGTPTPPPRSPRANGGTSTPPWQPATPGTSAALPQPNPVPRETTTAVADGSSQTDGGNVRRWLDGDAESDADVLARERGEWAAERARLIAKLRAATELLSSNVDMSLHTSVAASPRDVRSPAARRQTPAYVTASQQMPVASPRWRK